MPTKRQMEQLKEIQDPLAKAKYAKLLQLPQDLQKAMFDVQTADLIYQIAQDNHLTSEQLWRFSYLAGEILLGELHITELIKKIQEKCELSYENSRAIARQINQELFLPLKESLKIVHKIPRWPREEENLPTNQTPVVQPAPEEIKPAQPPTIQPAPIQPTFQNRLKTAEETRTINLKRE